MRQRLAIIATVAIILGLLILLNAASYVKAENPIDSESLPDRSTYNSGATGTRALYDLLSEAGYKVMRWRETPGSLLSQSHSNISTFVVIGRTQLPFEEEEVKNLLLWVYKGGQLVLIDRRPDVTLLPKAGNWSINVDTLANPDSSVDPGNPQEMTRDITSVHPVQPTLLTRAVESVKPSRFAAAIRFSYTRPKTAQVSEHGGAASAAASPTPIIISEPTDAEGDEADDQGPADEEESSGSEPDDESTVVIQTRASSANQPEAPVTHLQERSGALLVDFPHGAGRITVLSDPFMVANGGIQLEDNLQLALNTIASSNGMVAFDEYHQGRGSAQNAWAAYLAGTPILAIAGQLVLVLLVIVWTQARRFGRPLPLPQVDRRSSLEFVASMAELQQRARALDLAIENIYSRTRRVLTRYAGVDYHSSRSEIAERVAERSTLNRERLEEVMRECEEAINGTPVTERQSIALVRRLREIEAALGLRMRSRDVKQAAEKI